MSKILIVGFGTNQTRESVMAFLCSAREVYAPDRADLWLITNSVDGLEDILEKTTTTAISTVNVWRPDLPRPVRALSKALRIMLRMACRIPSLSETEPVYRLILEQSLHPHYARWHAYSRVLKTARGYESILLSDIRDVIFQDDIFPRLEPDRVALFEESEGFSELNINGRWYRTAYGETAFRKVRGKMPVCIGVIAGPAGLIHSIVDEFAAEIARRPPAGIEQAMFNYMLQEKRFHTPWNSLPNYQAGVATLSSNKDVKVRTRIVSGRILDNQGKPYPIVHMYDRVPDYFEACNARFQGPAPKIGTA